MALMTRAGLLLLLLITSVPVLADSAIEVRDFERPVMAERYRDLTASLRCPKCDAQAIDSSNSPVAADMRERVADLLRDGRSDKEILDYMVARFGEFVLYNPRLDERTWLLWGLPAALVLIGGLIVAVFVRKRKHVRVRALSAEERERLNALINREGSK
ncbi:MULTISPECIES: cytochrome c-type biogenesis protein [unclassified Halomonas]|uniref:cytochrome c-type biogenesis protein n=1 Tax=unclassified Halomonas TaxID=2609666 RepID=UPI0005FA1A67|nr:MULTISPECIES: cytochrome c-type biogenesis protein [unclassified Halomonas]MBR9879273.1 cytochrome c-type biogenesis protein CcmH [Gammaproteobacteria bacterium]MBS8269767.1 cytochrome c-type biogenesis protein CcmH [Halomonas litopenaei]KJZ17279.1 cytochrome C [Halomonas sp. S2151]MAY70532.1 cytochrome c-type biogenesis protein CcmH [Halomonas sp.]MCJ8284976.1 cytochrome c-type biogenesis protein CcmH [Halomonas sp.]|tara:strand:+ start:144 stop:620 length:477 start_codon:yes stop_codon:yes gene_type:complete